MFADDFGQKSGIFAQKSNEKALNKFLSGNAVPAHRPRSVLKSVLFFQPLPSSLMNLASTSRAVFSASPVSSWEYQPNVSML